MKTTILAALAAALLTGGCSRNTYRSTITQKYPDCEWVGIGADDTKFLVRKPDGSVWEVELGTFTADVWSEAQLFRPLPVR